MINSDLLARDIAKGVQHNKLDQVLDPGATPRRYEPASGVRKHNERIHRESNYVDTHKSLPFTFSKPPKPRGRSTYVKCDNCGHIYSGTSITVGVICKECYKFSSVTEVELDG